MAVTFVGSNMSDNVQGTSSGDTLYGGGGNDTLYGNAGADTISAGSTGDASGTGTSANDHTFLFGGDDADTIFGGKGHDYIFGNMGADSLIAGSGSDSIYGGNDADVINDTAATAQSVNYLSGDNGDDTINVGLNGTHYVLGGNGNDTILVGTAMAPASNSDVLNLFGNQDNDTITVFGTGTTYMYGGQGNDTLSLTGSGANFAHEVFGNLGNDTITVSGGFNSVFGGQGNDTITATGTNDVIHGDIGNDTITLSGTTGGETVYGGQGADTITAGAGHTAADYFVIAQGDSNAAQDSTTTNGSMTVTVNGRGSLDTITNFIEGQDHLVIAGHNNLYVVGSQSHPQNVTVGSVTGSNMTGYDLAYDYAYGNSGSGATSHFGSFEYVEVHATDGTYLFTNDANHTAVFLNGTTTDLATNDVLAG